MLPDTELDALLTDVVPLSDEEIDTLLEGISVDCLQTSKRIYPLKRIVMSLAALAVLVVAALWCYQKQPWNLFFTPPPIVSTTALLREQVDALLSARKEALAPLAHQLAELYVFDGLRPDPHFYERLHRWQTAYEERREAEGQRLENALSQLSYGDNPSREEPPPDAFIPSYVGEFTCVELGPLEQLDQRLSCLGNELTQYIATEQLLRRINNDPKLSEQVSLHETVQKHRLDALWRLSSELDAQSPEESSPAARRFFASMSRLCHHLNETLEIHHSLSVVDRLHVFQDIREEVSDVRDRLGAL